MELPEDATQTDLIELLSLIPRYNRITLANKTKCWQSIHYISINLNKHSLTNPYQIIPEAHNCITNTETLNIQQFE